MSIKSQLIRAVVLIIILAFISTSLSSYLFKSQIGISAADAQTDKSLTIATNPFPSLIGQRVTISGNYSNSHHLPLVDQLVVLKTSVDGKRWFYKGTVKTNYLGRYSLGWYPSSTGRFYVSATSNDSQAVSEHISADYIVHNITELYIATKKGGTIFVCKGQYDVDTTIGVSNNLFMVGAGKETVFRTPPTKVRGIIRGYNVTNVHIANIKLDGERTPINFSGCSAIEFYYSSHLLFENLIIANLDKEGLVLNNCEDLILSHVSISTVWTGIVLRDCRNIVVRYNAIYWTAGDGIYITGSSSVTGCTNVTLYENSLRKIGDTGIDVSSSFGATSVSVKICGNNFTEYNVLTPTLEKNGIGITISRCKIVQVSGNIIASPKGGILVGKSVSNVEFRDNTVLNFSQYGIWIVSPTNVSSNKIIGGNGIGIRINPSSGNFEISSNTLENIVTAIEWVGPAPAIIIRNNTIRNPIKYGISDGGKDYWTGRTYVVNNAILDTRAPHKMQYGIYQSCTTVRWTLEKNYINGAVVALMFLAGSNIIVN